MTSKRGNIPWASIIFLRELRASVLKALSSSQLAWLGVLALFVLDFIITRRPHEVSMKEAIGWSIVYIALPVLFGVYLLAQFGGQIGLEYYTGYLVEKSLSVDNLFVFMLILSGFAVPKELQQRVLLIGVAGALVLRAIFIAVGATLIAQFAITFLFFGLILLATAATVIASQAVITGAFSVASQAAQLGYLRAPGGR